MQWEILIVVILTIGICTAFNEARLKRAARNKKVKAVQSKQHPDEKQEIS
ncbi:hypothetical protein ACFLUZ_01665 [Chloroflexota bacterium]